MLLYKTAVFFSPSLENYYDALCSTLSDTQMFKINQVRDQIQSCLTFVHQVALQS